MKSISEQLKTMNLHLRYTALEDRRYRDYGERKDKEMTDKRNEMVHRGDLISDLQAIQHLRFHNSKHIAAYEATPNAPKELVKTLDIRGSVTELFFWRDMPDKREEIQIAADEIVKFSLREPVESRQNLFDEATNGLLVKDYAHLLKLYGV